MQASHWQAAPGRISISAQIHDDFGNMQSHLDTMNIEVANAELQRVPNNTTELDVENSKKVLRLIDKMEEDEDVNCVYHNLEMTDALADALAAED